MTPKYASLAAAAWDDWSLIYYSVLWNNEEHFQQFMRLGETLKSLVSCRMEQSISNLDDVGAAAPNATHRSIPSTLFSTTAPRDFSQAYTSPASFPNTQQSPHNQQYCDSHIEYDTTFSMSPHGDHLRDIAAMANTSFANKQQDTDISSTRFDSFRSWPSYDTPEANECERVFPEYTGGKHYTATAQLNNQGTDFKVDGLQTKANLTSGHGGF
jgi:hypothetical protein